MLVIKVIIKIIDFYRHHALRSCYRLQRHETCFRKHLDMRFLTAFGMTPPAWEEWEEGSGAKRPTLPPKISPWTLSFRPKHTAKQPAPTIGEMLPGEISSQMSCVISIPHLRQEKSIAPNYPTSWQVLSVFYF